MKAPKLFLCLTLLLAPLITAFAQNYSIGWFSIDGGGGTSSGGPYTVSGTIGQPDAGTLSGGVYTIQGGFWAGIDLIQTPNAPFLAATRSGLDVTISWPLPADGWILEETPNSVSALPIWTTVTLPYTTNATHISVTVPAAATNAKFYRLRF